MSYTRRSISREVEGDWSGRVKKRHLSNIRPLFCFLTGSMVTGSDDIEQSSNNFGQCSKMIEDCSHCVRKSNGALRKGLRPSHLPNTATLVVLMLHAPEHRFKAGVLVEIASRISSVRCDEEAMPKRLVLDSLAYGQRQNRPPSREMPSTD